MKKIVFVLYFFIINQLSFGQGFERYVFDYNKLPEKKNPICSQLITEELNDVLVLIENLQSDNSVKLSKDIFEKSESCPEKFEVYAWALFRSGKWLESITVIDSAVKVYGANPDLILKRGYMNLEMAELGVGVRNIDGNSVYLSDDKRLNYNDSIFKKQNFLAALNDFKYISDSYKDRYQEIYITGYIYQKLEKFVDSNTYFEKLINVESYSDDASFAMAENYIGQEKYTEARKIFKDLEKSYPRNKEIHLRISELYSFSGELEKAKTYQQKANYFSWIPEYCNLPYNEANFKELLFFLQDNPVEEKIDRLRSIKKNNSPYAVDLYIAILNTHINHGNGVEEEIEKLLINTDSTVVPKIILLMHNAPSTCTVTTAASILAEIKDERGWNAMIDYLPRMENIPFTTIPPNIPEQIIKFDKEKGLIALMKWIKGLLNNNEEKSNDPLDELGNIFSSASIYAPLSIYKKEEIRNTAAKLEYSDFQLEMLLLKVFGKEK